MLNPVPKVIHRISNEKTDLYLEQAQLICQHALGSKLFGLFPLSPICIIAFITGVPVPTLREGIYMSCWQHAMNHDSWQDQPLSSMYRTPTILSAILLSLAWYQTALDNGCSSIGPCIFNVTTQSTTFLIMDNFFCRQSPFRNRVTLANWSEIRLSR